MQFTQSVNRRIEDHAARLKELGERTHKIASLEMGLDFTRERLIEVMEDMKGMPRKEDLSNLRQHIDTQFINLESSRIERDHASARRIGWFLAIFGIGLTIVTILVNVLRH